MSISILEKAINLYSECIDMDFADYEETKTEDLLFLYNMIQDKGEAKTIEWLYSEEFILQ